MNGTVTPEAYRAWRQSTLGSITERLEVELIMGLAGDIGGRRVLDVACGDGTYAIAAAERGADVTAVDVSPRMLDAARERAGARGLEIDFRRGDVTALPLPDAGFDVVTAITVLCFLGDTATEATEELARVAVRRGAGHHRRARTMELVGGLAARACLARIGDVAGPIQNQDRAHEPSDRTGNGDRTKPRSRLLPTDRSRREAPRPPRPASRRSHDHRSSIPRHRRPQALGGC